MIKKKILIQLKTAENVILVGPIGNVYKVTFMLHDDRRFTIELKSTVKRQEHKRISGREPSFIKSLLGMEFSRRFSREDALQELKACGYDGETPPNKETFELVINILSK